MHEHNHSHDGEEHEHEHSHYHNHEHSHDHSGSHEHHYDDHHDHHDHEHGCEVAAGENLTKEEKTLKILLHHWVDHNKSHEESFKEWVEKSKLMNKIEVSTHIQKAIEFMEKADEMLLEAQKHI
ncbi:zinc transporter [Clostridium sp. PL3]|uniref:Zinc transporter n=1 Tax=Clostridium thailandense TaxID=2794346 RepID=A0A949U268_9CLOT|nr:zinc transporter [Clostridium thailandense]